MIPRKNVAGNMFGREDSIKLNQCINPPIGCGREIKIGEKWPKLTFKEWTMSGLCDKCQDLVFKPREGCTCDNPCCSVDIGVGIMTCESQHCPEHGRMEPSS